MKPSILDKMAEVSRSLELYSIDDALLEAYANELGISDISVQQLVDSHRSLRQKAQRDQQEIRAELERMAEATRKSIFDETYIKKDELKHLTISQLIERLG